ncbi:MAG TPA: hypothetical protein VNN08_07910, partial [Thermoanaerobaculia bacterium]|nr:hypothetical protein [Thermoanaerobaculia bacterium]
PVYRNIGISRFKIAGREMPADWLESTVRAYLNGTYDGNLFDLLTMTPPELTTTDIVHLQNSSLQGFLDDLMNSQGMHFDTCCRWARTLWMNGSLRVADPGSDYSLRRDGGIRCQQRGIHQRHLVDLQANRDSVFGHSKLRPERAQE